MVAWHLRLAEEKKRAKASQGQKTQGKQAPPTRQAPPSRYVTADLLPAINETKRLLQEVPRDECDETILPHLLSALCDDMPVVFTKSKSTGLALYNGPPNADDKVWGLKLRDVPKTCRGASASEIFSDGSAMSQFQSDVRDRIALALGVSPEQVCIKEVTRGSVVVKYTISGLSKEQKEQLLEDTASLSVEDELKRLFGPSYFLSHEVPFSALALSFDLNDFDSRGTRSTWEGSTFQVGPPGKTRPYTQPVGWARYGLKVLDAFACQRWLHPFLDGGNWWRAFHGMRYPQHSAKAIFRDGFIASGDERHQKAGRTTGAAYGPGVYVSPLIATATAYCNAVQVNTQNGMKHYIVAFQVAVNPEKVREVGNEGSIWVAPDPDDVRPYGLLVKEKI